MTCLENTTPKALAGRSMPSSRRSGLSCVRRVVDAKAVAAIATIAASRRTRAHSAPVSSAIRRLDRWHERAAGEATS